MTSSVLKAHSFPRTLHLLLGTDLSADKQLRMFCAIVYLALFVALYTFA